MATMIKGWRVTMTDFVDRAITLLVRSSSSAHLKRATGGLYQQWTGPGSVQSQEGLSLAPLPQIIIAFKSCSRAKLQPTLLGIFSAPLLGKREGKRCPLKSNHSLFHGTQAMAWGQAWPKPCPAAQRFAAFLVWCLLCLLGLKLIWTSMAVILRWV